MVLRSPRKNNGTASPILSDGIVARLMFVIVMAFLVGVVLLAPVHAAEPARINTAAYSG